jgi:hypothetical protein
MLADAQAVYPVQFSFPRPLHSANPATVQFP